MSVSKKPGATALQGEAEHGVLAGGVGRQVRPAGVGDIGAEIDDPAPAALGHALREGLAEQVHGGDVHVVHGPPLVEPGGLQAAPAADGAVVDQDVHGDAARQQALSGARDGGGVAEVEGADAGRPAGRGDLAGDVQELGLVAGGQDQLGAGGGEAERDGAAEAP
jgi:hypothetical protein